MLKPRPSGGGSPEARSSPSTSPHSLAVVRETRDFSGAPLPPIPKPIFRRPSPSPPSSCSTERLLLAVGFWKRSAFIRWQALLLLVFTIGKTFLYDLRNLSQGYRVVSFLGLGALLMAISFAYQKDWLALRDSNPPTPRSTRGSQSVKHHPARSCLWQTASGQTPVADQQFLRYQRTITFPSGAGQTCAAIDPQIFPYAAPSLERSPHLSGIQGRSTGPRNPLRHHAQRTRAARQRTPPRSAIWDSAAEASSSIYEMPNRPYTDVTLDLAGQDFLATANVSGTPRPELRQPQTHLGEFTLFDLTGQRLSRSTTLHLQESSFPYLHIELTVISRARQPHLRPLRRRWSRARPFHPAAKPRSLYTTVAQATTFTQRGRQTIATFTLPERVPIERVSFISRPELQVQLQPRRKDHPTIPQGTPPSAAEIIAGTILRVHLTQTGRDIHQQQLSIPATLGSNLQSSATVEVAVENGDDTPLPLTAVRLEMRERKLCFDAPTAQPLTLFYGDPALTAPQYDYARLFSHPQDPSTPPNSVPSRRTQSTARARTRAPSPSATPISSGLRSSLLSAASLSSPYAPQSACLVSESPHRPR